MRKNLGSSATTRHKSWEKIPVLGSYLKFRGQNLGYLSPIFLEAKFGAQKRILEANCEAKPLGPPNMEVPPGYYYQIRFNEVDLISVFLPLKYFMYLSLDKFSSTELSP